MGSSSFAVQQRGAHSAKRGMVVSSGRCRCALAIAAPPGETPAVPPTDPETARWFDCEVLPHEPVLRAYLLGLLSPPDVDDILQDTYIRLLRARERTLIQSPRGLLFATARNAVRDLYRRRAVTHTIPIAQIDLSRVFDESASVAETVSRRQEADILCEAIADLPPRCREILLLRKFENLSHREIAARLDISENTVDAQLTKALHRCAEFFIRRGAITSQ